MLSVFLNLSFDVLSVICRLHNLTPFKISFYLVPPTVFPFREHTFFYLGPYPACHEKSTCASVQVRKQTSLYKHGAIKKKKTTMNVKELLYEKLEIIIGGHVHKRIGKLHPGSRHLFRSSDDRSLVEGNILSPCGTTTFEQNIPCRTGQVGGMQYSLNYGLMFR